jgi:hypothetical protein
MRDMCEDLKGLYFVIKGNRLREKWICNYEMFISFSKLSCIKESALSSLKEGDENHYYVDWRENYYYVD